MRLDKYLKVSRLIKRRTVANEACDGERVMVNGRQAKASYQVKPGDTLESVCTLTKSKGVFYFIDAKGYVDGKLCVSAELSFALIPNNK